MTAITYEFDALQIKTNADYLLQMVQGRRLSEVYHSHDFFEWLWVLRGSTLQRINDRDARWESHSICLLRPGDRHCFLEQSDDVEVLALSVRKTEFERFAAVFDPSLLTRVWKSKEVPRFSDTVELLSALSSVWRERGIDCKFLLSCFFKAYLDRTQYTADRPFRLSFALEEVKKPEHLRRGIEAFSEISHYSQSHVSRLIRMHFGMSPKRYINELRLQRAYQEIVLTRRPIEEIAEEVGFFSQSHFQKIFKSKFFVTPAALRKQSGMWTT